MRALVLGAGRMGRAIAHDLVGRRRFDDVVVADIDAAAARTTSTWAGAQPRHLRQGERFDNLLRSFDIAVSALPYRLNASLTHAAVVTGCHLVDLGGDVLTVARQRRLHASALRARVTVVPDCGVSPGLTNVLVASTLRAWGRADRVRIRVGGVPLRPRPPLRYAQVFALEGLVKEYAGQVNILVAGRLARVPPLGGLEAVRFPPPFSRMEAFYTSGGTSTMVHSFRGRVRDLDYKTIRHRGHRAAVLRLCGARPSASVLRKRLARSLRPTRRDALLLRVEVRRRGARRVWELMDRFDPRTGLTAMARTTGFTAAAVADLLAGGHIKARGVLPPELAVPPIPLVRALRARGLGIVESR